MARAGQVISPGRVPGGQRGAGCADVGVPAVSAGPAPCLRPRQPALRQPSPLPAAPPGTGIARTRYGINFRRPDGRAYSRPDPPGTASTRNLGIIMEAATDREARTITRQIADMASLTEPATDPDRAEYRDATGRLAAADIRHHLTATLCDRQVNPCAFLALGPLPARRRLTVRRVPGRTQPRCPLRPARHHRHRHDHRVAHVALAHPQPAPRTRRVHPYIQDRSIQPIGAACRVTMSAYGPHRCRTPPAQCPRIWHVTLCSGRGPMTLAGLAALGRRTGTIDRRGPKRASASRTDR
jgi:hypothetical protein